MLKKIIIAAIMAVLGCCFSGCGAQTGFLTDYTTKV